MMEKTININLGGTLFKIDEEAYSLLRNYLQNLDLKFRNTPGGSETLEDIESRIAEIFQSQKGLAGVISKENVEAMISIIGKPEDFGQFENEGSTFQHTARQREKMFRNSANEVFRAVGRVLFIIVRIFLIVLGTMLVLTGFLALLSFVMVFIFKFPGAFSTDGAGINLSYVPDFLNYIISPGIVPWVKALIVIIVSLPLLMIIYGGVKLIFWFKARDGFVWLIGPVLWVLAAAALSIIMFNEGVSHVETAKSISENYLKSVPDTLYIRSGQKISDLRYDNEISIPDEEYNIYISDEKKEVYIRTYLDISASEEPSVKLRVTKLSAGRSKADAAEKAERLLYNFQISGDTLFIDEFFKIPPDTKWSFDEVRLNLYIPQGTIICMDKITESQFHSTDNEVFVTDTRNRFWMMTEDGLEYLEPNRITIK